MTVLTAHQIRALFAQEAEFRMRHLHQILLDLESQGPDDGPIDSIFRELHTIKGSSGVAGLPEVRDLAHALEELVEHLRAGRKVKTPELMDTLFAGVDELAAVIARTADPDGTTVGGSPPRATDRAPATAAKREARTPPGDHARSHREPVPALPATHPAPASPHPAVSSRPDPEKAAGVVMVSLERLDELTRLVSESASAHLRVGRMLSDRFDVDAASLTEFNELSRALNDLQDRVMRTQMVAISTITDTLQRTVRDLARSQGKQIRWDARGTETELDRGVLHQLSDSLLHLVRNAVDHGIETPEEREAAGKESHATIRLHAMQLGSEVIVAVTDDGRGINRDRVRKEAARHGVSTEGLTDEELIALTLTAGLSTTAFVTDVSGRGVGLDVVRSNVEAVRGRIEVRSEPGMGSEFRIVVPITLAVLRCLLVEAGGHRYALPFHRVVRSQPDEPASRAHAEGRPMVWVDRQAVPVSVLAATLGGSGEKQSDGPIVVLADSARRHAFKIDRLLGQRDVVVKGLSRILPHVPAVAGASVEPDGTVLLVLDPPGLIQRARQSVSLPTVPTSGPGADTPRRRILVVDDALTVRELQRSILERADYSVRVASDGREALSLLAEEPSDLVMTDVEMPHLDGFGLTEAIRADQDLTNIPVLILSSRASDADRERGLGVGADGYIVKSRFDEGSLLTAVERLLGSRR